MKNYKLVSFSLNIFNKINTNFHFLQKMYKFSQSEKRGLHLSFHEYNGKIQPINIPKIKDTLLCYKNIHNQY